MAAIAKARAANNGNEPRREILGAHRSRRLGGGPSTKQSGYDPSDVGTCNAIRRFAAAVSARGQNANVGSDHGTGVSATDYSAKLGRNRETGVSGGVHNGTGVSATGYNFGR